MSSDDLHVASLSEALAGFSIDLIVSGSIGAVESVRFIRALRRLSCEIHPWLTEGGAQFTTETALSWAAARPCKRQFDGNASHIGGRDACVIAPASASIIGKLAQGLTDSPATALAASYLGQGKPVLLVPNMHDSLITSPYVAANLEKLRKTCIFLEARREEGKQKFPEPKVLADQIAHQLNSLGKDQGRPILVTMGTTRGYIDEIRYISNYSSGALGTQLTHELYRQGFPVHVVSGPCPQTPRSYATLHFIETNEEMSEAVRDVTRAGLSGAVFAASVLDFIPATKRTGKIRSSEDLKVEFIKTPKIIGQLTEPLPFKVGFKLETEFNAESESLARDYLRRYALSHLVMNIRSDVSEHLHRALVFTGERREAQEVRGKEGLAIFLAAEAKRLIPHASLA